MFRHVPECSGMFRVPGFIDGRNLLYNKIKLTSSVYRPYGCISSLGMILKKLAARFAMSVPVRE